MDPLIKTKNDEMRGQILIILAMSLIVLAAVVGLATDATILYIEKQQLQRAIDSAAIAGSTKLPNQAEAMQTVYEFMRLHDYDFDPSSNPLLFTFPIHTPPRHIMTVQGSSEVQFYFVSLIGINNATVTAGGEAESAFLDTYLIFDLSLSMVYDTRRPWGWPRQAVGGCTNWWDNTCVAKYCNFNRNCDPLDKKIKPAAKFFIDQLASTYDRVGLVGYNLAGSHVLPLEYDFNVVKEAIDNMDAYDQGGRSTNIGDGILFAHQNIAIEGRMDAIWSMVLLTDGRANVYRDCPDCPLDCGAPACQVHEDCHGCPPSENWAIKNAIDTWDRHETVIYTIAYGDIFTSNPSYRNLMIEIADITDNGITDGTTENFWATPNQSKLEEAFEEIAERIYTRLLR